MISMKGKSNSKDRINKTGDFPQRTIKKLRSSKDINLKR